MSTSARGGGGGGGNPRQVCDDLCWFFGSVKNFSSSSFDWKLKKSIMEAVRQKTSIQNRNSFEILSQSVPKLDNGRYASQPHGWLNGLLVSTRRIILQNITIRSTERRV